MSEPLTDNQNRLHTFFFITTDDSSGAGEQDYKTMTWDKNSVKDRLENNPDFNDFIDGKICVLRLRISGVDCLIYAHIDNKCLPYFAYSYNEKLNYDSVYEFFDIAGPIIDELLEKAAMERLTKL